MTTAERRFERAVTGAIVANSAVMALALLDEEHAELLERVDVACLWFFAGELLFRVYRARLGFFRSPWCCADAAIILMALAPVAGGGIAVLRIARLARSAHLLRHLSHARLVRLLRTGAARRRVAVIARSL
jgi:voltage-gated sodium channel